MISKYRSIDYPIIAEWYKKRGMKPPSRGSLSSMGYIADNRVAGWLYLTNSNIAFIDGFISNPDTVPSLRRESVKKLGGMLVDTALSLGYSHIIALSSNKSVQNLCSSLGFEKYELNTWILKDKELFK